VSALVDQIVTSMHISPDRWHFSIVSLKREDGVELTVIKPFEGWRRDWARLDVPDRGPIRLSWFDARRLQAAFSKWQHRPLGPKTTAQNGPRP
jgi:hypothetical protein